MPPNYWVATDEIAAEWKMRLLEVVKPYAGLPMFFSGGMDSATLLAAQLELGATPDLYTVYLQGQPDTPDLISAQEVAKRERLTLDMARIGTDLEEVEEDCKEVIALLDTSRKAAVQCSLPVLAMAKSMRADGHERAILGTCHVALDGRAVAVLLAAEGEEAARELRTERYNDRWREGHPTWCMHRVAALVGLLTEEPYSEEPLRSYALSLDMAELNRPVQKGIAVRAFPEFFRRNPPRLAVPLQIGSGIRELHDQLLLARYSAGAVVAVYNRWRRELSEPALF